jgi:hypothetical protein
MDRAKRFREIRREHVEQACRDLLQRGLGPERGFYFVRFQEKDLPAKVILKEAYKLATGVEISSSAFSGGSYTARYLEALNFQVVVRPRAEPPSNS